MIRQAERSTQKGLVRQIRRLTQALIVSGGVNIVLLIVFFYGFIRESTPELPFRNPYLTKKTRHVFLSDDRSAADVIQEFRGLSREQLIIKLNNKKLIENGYTHRDLALACLVQFHDFDLFRALTDLRHPHQRRALKYSLPSSGQQGELIVYPEMTEKHYRAIVQFATTEKWPLTNRGLFRLLQSSEFRYDPSLAETFFLSSEFLAVETLFKRTNTPVTKEGLLQLLCDGTWEMFSQFAKQQETSPDFSLEIRRRFLLNYVEKRSKAAAMLLLRTDTTFATKKLGDKHVLAMLEVLEDNTPEVKAFAMELLSSPRSDLIWKASAACLYKLKSPDAISQANTNTAASFVPQSITSKKILPTYSGKEKTAKRHELSDKEFLHIVQTGDSLWRIAHHYNTNIEVLKEINQLDSDLLRKGMSLKIPKDK